MNLKRKRKGFTLVELIIVIAVIGVLAAILIPVFANVVEKANAKSALSDARNAVSSYVTDAADKLASGIHMPENITIIVEKASKYYVFGYNMNNGGVIMVSTGNPYPASDTVDLVDNYSWNGLQTGDYDPDVPEATLSSYSIATHGGFYLVPYTNTTPDNPAVRGIALRTAGTYRLLNREMDAEVDAGTEIYHGCIVGRNYVGADESAPASNNAGNQTPTPTPTPTPNHTVTFNFTGLTSGDEANVVLKKGSEVLTNPASIPDGTYVNELTAEYPHNEITDEYWYTVGTATADSPVIHGDTTVTFNFTKVNIYTLNFVMGSGETFVPASGASATMRLREGDDIASIVRDSSATTETAGYTFRYWTEQGSAENFAPGTGALTMPARNVTLVPYFSLQNISVTYKAGDHATGDDYDDSVTYGTHTLPSFDTIATAAGWTKDANYDFLRWYDGSNEYQAGANYTFTSATTLTARYTELNYTVTINQPAGVTAVTGGGTYNLSVNSVDFTVTLNSNYYLTGYSVSGLTGTTTLPADATSIDTTAATAGNTIVITPNVAAKTVNVTFVSVPTGATGMPASGIRTFTTDGNTISLTTPTLTHYHGGTYAVTEQSGATGTIDGTTLTLATDSTGSITVTATLEADPTFSIIYNKNTDDTVTGMPSNQTGLYPDTYSLGSAAPERDGYTFLGWGATNNATTYITSVTITDNSVTVYAIWEQNAVQAGQTVTFNLTYKDRTGSSDVATGITYTRNCPVGTYTLTGKELQAAGAWAPTVPYSSSIRYFYGVEYNTTTAKNSWDVEILSGVTSYDLTIYTNRRTGYMALTYDANGIEGKKVDYYSDPYTEITIMNNIYTRKYYNFTGWNTSADGSGTSYAPGQKDDIAGSVTLYAQWQLKPGVVFKTITFDGNGNDSNSFVPDSITASVGETVYLPDNTGSSHSGSGFQLRKSGYVFAGWNTRADGTGTSYSVYDIVSSSGAPMQVTDDVTLYAMWSDSISLQSMSFTYHANCADAMPPDGGSTGMTYQSDGLTCTTTTLMTTQQRLFIRPGYDLKGWCTSPDGNGTFYPIKQSTYCNATGVVSMLHLYAVWTERPDVPLNTFTITVSAGGSTVAELEIPLKAGFQDGSSAPVVKYRMSFEDILSMLPAAPAGRKYQPNSSDTGDVARENYVTFYVSSNGSYGFNLEPTKRVGSLSLYYGNA